MHPFHHAVSSARLHGGDWTDYFALHQFFDVSKSGQADSRHRAVRHHLFGISWARRRFGDVIANQDGLEIPVEELGRQHLREDLGRDDVGAPEWFVSLRLESWMTNAPGTQRHGPVDPGRFPQVGEWFEEPVVAHDGNPRMRALRYHALGIYWCEEELGITLPDEDGKPMPTRVIAEGQVRGCCGRIPPLSDWLRRVRGEKWMSNTPAGFARDLALVDDHLTRSLSTGTNTPGATCGKEEAGAKEEEGGPAVGD